MSRSSQLRDGRPRPDDKADRQRRAVLRRDGEMVLGLVAIFGSLRLLHGVSVWIGVGVLVVGVVRFHPKILIVAGLLLLGARAGHALDSLQAAESGVLDGVEVSLVSDPRSARAGWSAQGDIDGQRVLLTVGFGVLPEFADSAVGDTFVVSGSMRGSAPRSSWAISRRIVGNVSVTEVHEYRAATGITGAANAVRSLYRDGVQHLSSDDQALFTGLVFGDDRGQNPIDADNFRASGLGHLLAVSGSNVAFVLLIAAPVLVRVRWVGVRLVLVAGLLVGFGFLTRFEPSVLRALVMAGLVVVGGVWGRGWGAGVVLLPGVVLLVVVDPLLGWSLGFGLSVVATVGLVVLGWRVSGVVGGVVWLRGVVGGSVGAQLCVAPLLLVVFGGVSLVAVPANVLAGPAAAGVMMWGLVVGVVAGVAPVLGPVLHVPTVVLLWWVRLVASVFGGLGVGAFGWWHLGVVVAGLVMVLVSVEWWGGVWPGWWRTVAVGLITLGVGVPLLVPAGLSVGSHVVADGVTVVRGVDGVDVVVLEGGVEVGDALEGLRRARLGRVDLVVAVSGSRSVGLVVFELGQRFELVEVWAPVGHQVPGAVVMGELSGSVGSLRICETDSGVVVLPATEARC